MTDEENEDGVQIVSIGSASLGTAVLEDGTIYYTPNGNLAPPNQFDFGNAANTNDVIGQDSVSFTLSNGRTANVGLDIWRSHRQPHADVDNWDVPNNQRAALADQLDDLAPQLAPDGTQLVISRFAQLPTPAAMEAATNRAGNLYVLAQSNSAPGQFPANDGIVFEISRNPNTGETTVSEFFDIGAMIRDLPDALNINITMEGSRGDGPRSVAFHPEFDNLNSPGYWIDGELNEGANNSADYGRIVRSDGGWDDATVNAAGVLAGDSFVTRESVTVVEYPIAGADDVPGVGESVVFDGSRYQRIEDGLTWSQASARAAELGGRLLEVDSSFENVFVVDAFWNEQPIWLGWNDAESEGTFVGVDGPTGYVNWLPGEPATSARNGQDFARIASADGQWDDASQTAAGVFNGVSFEASTTMTIIEFP